MPKLIDELPKAKLGSAGWLEIGEARDDANRNSLTQRLRQRVLDENVVCLIGSGVSLGAGGPSMGDLWKLAVAIPDFLLALTKSEYPKEGKNIEVFLSRCRIIEQLQGADTKLSTFTSEVQKAIATACRDFLKSTNPLSSHCDFLQRVACRPSEKSRALVFTTNYDLCIEQAAGNIGLPVIDGFSHTSPQRFDGRNYDLDYVRRVPNQREPSFVEGVFHLYKLHGSVNWKLRDDGQIQRVSKPESAVMIYPRETKYQLSYQQPFLEMMARFQFALRQPNTTLFVLGFGFNDDHLSEPIISALRSNPQFNLVVAVRGLATKSEGDEANDYLKKLSDFAGSAGVENVTLFDGTFDDFVPIIPAISGQTEEQRFAAIARQILLPKGNA